MDGDQSRLIELFKRYQARTISPVERQILLALMLNPANEAQVKLLIEREMEAMPGKISELKEGKGREELSHEAEAEKIEFKEGNAELKKERAEEIINEILASGGNVINLLPKRSFGWTKSPATPYNQRTRKNTAIVRWTAAAAIIILFGLGAYYYATKENRTLGRTSSAEALAKVDILPGGQRAMLTLADGSTINLDSAANGQLAIQVNASVIKTSDGRLIYQMSGSHYPALADERSGTAQRAMALRSTNTMTTPRGGQYQLSLPDGTRVWLNAASSITYPTAFTGKERNVNITGEVYFEVTKNVHQPFIVKTDNQLITVLGTSFNVNAYTDEAAIKTSLVRGSVKVNGTLLSPGQAYTDGKVVITQLEQDLAWKNGLFNFDNITLKAAMRQLSRWYDVEVDFPDDLAGKQFVGEMGRDLTLAQVLKVLDGPDMHFSLRGRTIFVRR